MATAAVEIHHPKDDANNRRKRSRSAEKENMEEQKWVEKKRKDDPENILTRTGGAYIPPARLRMLQEQISDKSSVAYQRMAWEALKKSINGLINKVNVSNITDIVRELFQENIVRGRGLLARSIITAQSASPTFTNVYACLVSIINTKFPQTGELIIKRIIIQFRKSFRRNDKKICLSSVRFIAHLVNQQVVHELLALEVLTVLLDHPTSDSVEVAVGFLKECGAKLTELSPRGVLGVFESFKGILHDATVDVRVQYMIEVMFAVRKDKFSDYPAVVEGLDLIQEDDQITHLIELDEEGLEGEELLNVFKPDPEFLENDEKYRAIKEEILGEGSSNEDGEEGEDESEGSDEEEMEEDGEMKIIDETQTDLMGLRRTIYLTIMSSLDFEECAHKLLKMEFKPTQELEVANMIIECCSQERSYQRFYGLLGERFCLLNEVWVEKFDTAFQEQYSTVHRLEANKLRNVAKFFAQLFFSDALPWTSLSCIHLNEDETNSSSRIFVKILFQELAEFMGLQKLNERLKDPTLASFFEGLLPRDNPRNCRFAINFFTSIGLGGLTDDLREHLKNAPKMIMAKSQDSSDEDTSGSSSDSSDTSSDSSSESDEEESSDSDDDMSDDNRRANDESRRKGDNRRAKDEESRRKGDNRRAKDEESRRKDDKRREKDEERRKDDKRREKDEERRKDDKRREKDEESRRKDDKRREKDEERRKDDKRREKDEESRRKDDKRREKDEERRKDDKRREKDEESRRKDDKRREKDEERRKDDKRREKDEESRRKDDKRREKDEESRKKDDKRREKDAENRRKDDKRK